MTFFKTYSLKKYKSLVFPIGVMGGLIYLSALGCEVEFDRFWKGMAVGGRLIVSFFPPAWGDFGDMMYPALETLLLAVIATPLAVVVSFGVALMSANNVSGTWVRSGARFLMSAERATPDIIVAFFFVAAFGIGPMAGIIALALGSIGMLGKLFADAMEEIDPRLLEAIECVGASKLQVLRYGILPSVLPSMVANSLFRFEINIRSAALLGMVGAGGIGYELSQAMALLEYQRATVAILVTVAMVFLAERVSGFLRHKILTRSQALV
ncbi:MAG: phosphonate ABC transporter, permease protein PhnE [Candidatus Latescibacterota bacterium]